MNNYKFSEVVEIISGGTPKTSVSEYWNGDIPWISVADFNNDLKYIGTTEKKITEKGLKNSNTKLLHKGDIIISARGTVGALGVLTKNMAFNQSCFGLRSKTYLLNQGYLFYYLKNYIKNIKKKSQGSVFDTINLDTFEMIEFNLPTLSIQEKIDSLLTKIDQKIEINNSINDNLPYQSLMVA